MGIVSSVPTSSSSGQSTKQSYIEWIRSALQRGQQQVNRLINALDEMGSLSLPTLELQPSDLIPQQSQWAFPKLSSQTRENFQSLVGIELTDEEIEMLADVWDSSAPTNLPLPNERIDEQTTTPTPLRQRWGQHATRILTIHIANWGEIEQLVTSLQNQQTPVSLLPDSDESESQYQRTLLSAYMDCKPVEWLETLSTNMLRALDVTAIWQEHHSILPIATNDRIIKLMIDTNGLVDLFRNVALQDPVDDEREMTEFSSKEQQKRYRHAVRSSTCLDALFYATVITLHNMNQYSGLDFMQEKESLIEFEWELPFARDILVDYITDYTRHHPSSSSYATQVFKALEGSGTWTSLMPGKHRLCDKPKITGEYDNSTGTFTLNTESNFYLAFDTTTEDMRIYQVNGEELSDCNQLSRLALSPYTVLYFLASALFLSPESILIFSTFLSTVYPILPDVVHLKEAIENENAHAALVVCWKIRLDMLFRPYEILSTFIPDVKTPVCVARRKNTHVSFA